MSTVESSSPNMPTGDQPFFTILDRAEDLLISRTDNYYPPLEMANLNLIVDRLKILVRTDALQALLPEAQWSILVDQLLTLTGEDESDFGMPIIHIATYLNSLSPIPTTPPSTFLETTIQNTKKDIGSL